MVYRMKHKNVTTCKPFCVIRHHRYNENRKEGIAMSEYTMGAVEMRFAEIIWEHEPVSSGELVKLCEQELNWKKSTTYTVLRRLCQKGIFISEKVSLLRCCRSRCSRRDRARRSLRNLSQDLCRIS